MLSKKQLLERLKAAKTPVVISGDEGNFLIRRRESPDGFSDQLITEVGEDVFETAQNVHGRIYHTYYSIAHIDRFEFGLFD